MMGEGVIGALGEGAKRPSGGRVDTPLSRYYRYIVLSRDFFSKIRVGVSKSHFRAFKTISYTMTELNIQ